jgi:hypothetical protein
MAVVSKGLEGIVAAETASEKSEELRVFYFIVGTTSMNWLAKSATRRLSTCFITTSCQTVWSLIN